MIPSDVARSGSLHTCVVEWVFTTLTWMDHDEKYFRYELSTRVPALSIYVYRGPPLKPWTRIVTPLQMSPFLQLPTRLQSGRPWRFLVNVLTGWIPRSVSRLLLESEFSLYGTVITPRRSIWWYLFNTWFPAAESNQLRGRFLCLLVRLRGCSSPSLHFQRAMLQLRGCVCHVRQTLFFYSRAPRVPVASGTSSCVSTLC